MVEKQQLREEARSRRRAFVAGLDPLAHRLAFKVLPSPLAQMIGARDTVALYTAMDDEAPAQRLGHALIAHGKTVALACALDRLGSMEFRRWNPDDPLVPGPFGTSHPPVGSEVLNPDVIVAPLLAFDARMGRLGQGGGYYDRAFARHPDALRIGLAWSVQEIEIVPTDPWDLPLDAVLTETSLIEGVLA
ncbi:MAG: 5-formyltetrahydrofolate cyclo-ligase [Sphingobium sp.]|uniref:5-formyltetrahydrofolate cyclo-ligase n=1 Tax=Sphingobium sp. TaxID=1912891 RepID=UPI0029B01065|nr:5-formyltetrahydrofolate cyclo-ligase [Sphingobium sp.]MDX3909022.1 5-formyltetrahydrofolate cyclo-ligase [Sphingobium sp.]